MIDFRNEMPDNSKGYEIVMTMVREIVAKARCTDHIPRIMIQISPMVRNLYVIET